MATARARALSLCVLLALALCITACAGDGERQPTNRYISYAGLPRGSAGNGRRSAGSAITGRCKSCHGQPPTMAAVKTTAAESKGAYISHAAVPEDKNPATTMTGAKTAAAGPEGAYKSPAALSEEKRKYIRYAALKNDQPQGKQCPSCP